MGGKSSTSSSSVTVPREVLERYQTVNERAAQVADRPFHSYGSDPSAFIAGMTPTQQAGVQDIRGSARAAQPYFGTAAGYAAAGGGSAPLGGLDIQRYMSPYLRDVYAAHLAGQQMTNAQQQSALKGDLIKAGAFGGDRAGVAHANLAYMQNLANAQSNADLLNRGFSEARDTAAQQQGADLAARQADLARFGTTADRFAALGTGADRKSTRLNSSHRT